MGKSRLFLTLLLAYVLHLLLKFAQAPVPQLFSSYFADLLSLPILLTLSVLFIRKVQRDIDFTLDRLKIFFVFVYQSYVFEVLLPSVSPKFTSDPYDVLAYAAGAFFFVLFQARLLA